MKDIVLIQRVSTKEKVFFTRQLSVMISAGVSIDNAINLIAQQSKNQSFKKILSQVYRDIEAGETLSEALSKYPNVFDKVYLAIVSSGEASGKLDRILSHLSDRMESMEAFKGKIKAALAYPIFIILTMIIIMVIMMVKVIPSLKQVFEESEIDLPWTTQLIISVSDFMAAYWWLVLIIVAVVAAGLYLICAKTKSGRYAWDSLKLKIPILKEVTTTMYMARFARIFSMLISAGIPIIETLKITARSVNNRVYVKILKNVISQVERGVPISVPLEKEPAFPAIVPQMIMVGEQTGKLEQLLEKLADYYDNETDTKIKTLSNLIEPVIIVIIGIGVGFLVYSILFPIYNLAQNL